MSEDLHKRIAFVNCFRPKPWFLALLKVSALLLLALPVLAQEIPKGVRYKSASESVNAAAKSSLETAFASDEVPTTFFGDAFVCGPLLWKSLKPTAEKVLLDAKPVIGFISIPEPIQTQAKGIVKPEERQSFWRTLRAKYPNLKSAKVRKAQADEISYYWAMIPFDIEEPFFVLETSSERFVVHLLNKNGNISLFWIDVVGDLRSLK